MLVATPLSHSAIDYDIYVTLPPLSRHIFIFSLMLIGFSAAILFSLRFDDDGAITRR